MGELFERRWSLVVGDRDLTDLDIAFTVERGLGRTPGQATVRVWNLGPDTKAALQVGQTVSLRAGYRDDGDPVPTIFVGQVRRVRTETDGIADRVTTITARDGGAEYFLARASRSYGPGTPVRTVVRDIASDLGLGQGNLSTFSFRLRNGQDTFPDGWSHSGPARDALDTLVRGCGFRWSIQHGALQLIQRGRGLQEELVVLAPDTGLLDSPSKDDHGKVTAKALLRPGLEPGRRIRIESAELTGEFVIRHLTVTGDTKGQDFMAEVEARAPVVA